MKNKKGESGFSIEEHLFDILLWVIVFVIGVVGVYFLLKQVNVIG